MSLKGKRVVVVGGTSGIGLATAKAFLDESGQQLPVGRIAQPEDIAESYVYLAKNGFTSGSVVLIDGGAHLV